MGSKTGIDIHGNPVVISNELFDHIRNQGHSVGYRRQTLLEGLYEMFPELSRNEIRRLVRGGALIGVLDDYEYNDVEEYVMEPGWPEFELVILGKNRPFGPRWGMFIR